MNDLLCIPLSKVDYVWLPKLIKLHQGINVLTGCNGIGKSTALKQINKYLKSKKNIAHYNLNLNKSNQIILGN